MVAINYSVNFSNSYITVPSTSNFSFGMGDFSVEAWIYTGNPRGGGVTSDQVIFGGFNASSPDFLCFLQNSDNAPCFWNGSNQYTSSITVPSNTWTHVAWVRNDYVLRIYVNGVIGLTSYTFTTVFATASTWYIGRDDAAADRYFNGYISNLRVIKGNVPYSLDFSSALPVISFLASDNPSTVLLTCQSSSIVDSSGLNTLSLSTPQPTVSLANPFTPSTIGSQSIVKITPAGNYYTAGELDEYNLSISPPNLIGTVSKLYSNGVLQTTGELDEYTLSISPPSTGTVVKQYANGVFRIKGTGFDEVSGNMFGGQTLNYTFNVTANNSVNNSGLCDVIVSFLGTTITANSGGYAVGQSGGSAGLYSIITDGFAITGGANGGAGSSGFGGTSGGPGGASIGSGTRDIGGLFAFLTSLGGYSTSTFGAGGSGGNWMGGGGSGYFAGGGGGGSGAGGGGYVAGGLAAFLLQYITKGVTYYQLISQNADQITSTGGGINFPQSTTYVKVWAIGKGGMSGMSGTFTQYSAGAGGAGGTAYAEFSAASLGNLNSSFWQSY